MGDLGIRVVRIYTLHPPAFYDELAAYNEAHADAPLYLVQGAYLPDESYVEAGRTPLRRRPSTSAFRRGARRPLRRRARRPDPRGDPGRGRRHLRHRRVARGCRPGSSASSGTRRASLRTDRGTRPAVPARARTSPPPTTPRPPSAGSPRTWTTLAALEADARHLGAGRDGQLADRRPARAPRRAAGPRGPRPASTPTTCCPPTPGRAGTFASFHAYPYYPDFQRYEPGLQDEEWNGTKDAYAGYLMSLQEHFAAAHAAAGHRVRRAVLAGQRPRRHQRAATRAAHSEQEAMAMDADMMRMMEDKGLARRVRLRLDRRVVQADLEHHGAPGRRAPPALARPADQRAVVRPGRHRPGPGRRTPPSR